MPLHLKYALTGSGWSECTLSVDDVNVTTTASYLSDALDSLCLAVIGILRGEAMTRASFDEEPGEYRWLFNRLTSDRLRIRILMFRELWANRPDVEGETIFDAECRLRTFAGALVSELQRLLAEHGLEGYRGKWIEHDFPEKRLAELQELLAKRAERERGADAEERRGSR
jgi:hypothetical protein